MLSFNSDPIPFILDEPYLYLPSEKNQMHDLIIKRQETSAAFINNRQTYFKQRVIPFQERKQFYREENEGWKYNN